MVDWPTDWLTDKVTVDMLGLACMDCLRCTEAFTLERAQHVENFLHFPSDLFSLEYALLKNTLQKPSVSKDKQALKKSVNTAQNKIPNSSYISLLPSLNSRAI